MSTNSRHLGRGESGCPVPCGAEPDTTFKDQLLLRTYPGTERSSLPTAGMHDRVQIFQAPSTNAQNHQTRDHPDMFPLHDVLEPAEHFNDARCALNVFSETCFWTKQQQRVGAQRSSIWWSQTGSNRRPHACKARALPTELWPQSKRTRSKGCFLRHEHVGKAEWPPRLMPRKPS
jgi:hypothetical protein